MPPSSTESAADGDLAWILGSPVPIRCSDSDFVHLQTAGALESPWERGLVVSGRDSARFLHNLLTQDVIGMELGSVRPAVLADRKGHVVTELWLWRAADDRFVIRAHAAGLERLTSVLDRHRVMERVAWGRQPDPLAAFLIVGPAAAAAIGVASEAEAGTLPAFGEEAFWMRVCEITAHDRVVLVPQDRARELGSFIQAPRIGWEAFDRARIEAGRAWGGLDVDDERLVPEAGWDDRISYDKGCYLGQETLARLHYQGRLNWRLVRLTWDDAEAPSGTDLLDANGQRVGWITSVCRVESRFRALGYLHRRAREETTENPRPPVFVQGAAVRWTSPDALDS